MYRNVIGVFLVDVFGFSFVFFEGMFVFEFVVYDDGGDDKVGG